jgi:hypothetical protein
MTSPTLNRTAVDIIKKALRLLRVVDAELSLNAVDRETGIETLNDLVKSWQNSGFHLWTLSEALMFLEKGKAKYQFGAGFTNAISDTFNTDTITADYVPLSFSLSVADSSIYTVGELILLTLDSGLQFETTVNGLGAGTIAISAEPSTALSSGGTVILDFEYIDRPMSVVQLRFRDANQSSDIPTNQWSRTEYFNQPDKSSQGTVTTWYYTPVINRGDLYVWQTPSSNFQTARFTYVKPTEVTTANAENPDFPSEWFLTLAYNLASMLAPEYGITMEKYQIIESKAQQLLEDSLGFDNEDSYIKIEPDFRR